LFESIKKHSKPIIFAVSILSAVGIGMAFYMPVSLFPDITFPRIVILADNGEQPAERMMIEVTKPLEELASSIPGIQIVRSTTGRGSTEVSLSFAWGTDILQAQQMLQGRIASARTTLPATATIEVEQMSVAVFPILGYSLTSDSLSQVDLRDIAYYQIRPAIMRVPGVSRVMVTGGDTREFQVTVNPEKLAAYHLDIRQINDAIVKSNIIEASGLVENNYQLYLSVISGLVQTTDEIGNVAITFRNGAPIFVRDVADVRISTAPNYIRTTAHGRPAVLIDVIKQTTGSTVQIGKQVNDVVSHLSLPASVRFENWYDQGYFIDSSMASTRDSIIVGIILSMLIMLLFLRSFRTAGVLLIVVPATIATSIVFLKVIGQTINIMTLGGIAAAVGLIIDDSIVAIERIFAVRDNAVLAGTGGLSSTERLISSAIGPLMPAIIASTLGTIVINLPLLFLRGIVGAFFLPLAVTMIIALLISFLYSISLAPLLTFFNMRSRKITGKEKEEGQQSLISNWYRTFIERFLRHRWLIIPVTLIIIAATYLIYTRVGSGFMPDMDEGTFVLDYVSPPGTSLEETNRMLMQVEDILLKVPEVEAYSRRTGTQLGFFLTEPNIGDFLVKLKKKRSRSIDEIISDVRSQIEGKLPTLEVDFGQLMMDVIGDLTNNPKPIEIKLFGDNIPLLQKKAKEVARVISSVPGVVDVFDGVTISGPSIVIHVDEAKAARAGLTVEDVIDQLQTVMEGSAETGVQMGEKVINIRTQYPKEFREDLNRISEISLTTESGGLIKLNSITTFENTGGQAELTREGSRPVVSVTARIEGRDLGHTISDIKSKLAGSVNIPKGVQVEYGGVYQTQQESFRGLVLVALLAFALVFFVLLVQFGEFAAPVTVMIISLLSLLGLVSALWITGVTFNVSSFVGLVMIIGIVAENGIFVMYEVKLIRSKGTNLEEALIQALQIRARPIIMTALAATLALLPLALGIGAGAQMQQPLAIAVIGGFCASSIMLFFVMPLLYAIIQRKEK
jgi:CzcA family heavy metal efflux pump